ncbi:MAG TPA: AraC family transcriptional regulator [Polyangiaceae bacterium]|nr:AraC family transcriptional regulator [Polyangiaceae bacterium]
MAVRDAPGNTLSGRVAVRVVDFVAARGHDPEALCRSVGLSLESLRAEGSRVPYAVVRELGERASELARDPNLGLHLAQDVRDTSVYDAGLLMLMSSPCVRTGLERMTEYQRYWGDGERVKLFGVPGGASVRLMNEGTADDYQRQSDECAMAEIVVGFRAISGRDVVPRAVRFRHPAPADVREHQTLFRCELRFAAPHTELELADGDLDAPLPHANEIYSAIFQGQVERALARLPKATATAKDVRAAAQAALASGRCTLAGTARALGTSERTLQRRLQEEGTSFAELVDCLRHEMAIECLDKQLSVAEIACLLGYSDPSAFHHAFKRWTGTTPEQSRVERAGTRDDGGV